MSGNSPDFVKWREEFVSQERGSRVVHYYLEDSKGDSHLAVVGTERSLRHMLYVVSEEFCQAYGPDKSGIAGLKWRSRREVVDWLTSFLPAKTCTESNSKSAKYELPQSLIADVEVNGFGETGGYLFKHTDKGHNPDIVWSGVSWTCGKQLRHYQAFCRNGTTIATHSFVLVMSEVVNRYLAYLEDMYEDKKGQKKVKVRWFHQNQEFACTIPPPTPHPSEVFITPYSQVISAECVDDIATVLTPDHYEKCLASLPCASTAGIRLCFRQYSKNKFKLFDLRTLRGYFNQAVLARLDISTMFGKEEEEPSHGKITKRAGPKRIRFIKGHQKFSADRLAAKMSGHVTACRPAYENLKYELPGGRPLSVKFVGPRNWPTPPFKVGEKVELLCQDSGIRGCWFKCTVLQLSHKRLKVRYDDLQNVDGCGNVEEWIPAFRPAAPDKLGMRCSGRPTIRPCPLCDCLLDTVAFLNGTPVDAWWNDGWWEGVVVGTDSCEDDSLQVYFPGEDVFLMCQRKNLRISKDWVGNQWVNIQAKPDILSAISSVSHGAKLTAWSIFTKRAESGSSAMSDQEVLATQAHSNEEDKQAEASLSDRTDLNTKQVNSRKRPRDEGAEEDSEEKVAIGGDES